MPVEFADGPNTSPASERLNCYIEDHIAAYQKIVAEMFPDVPLRCCANHFCRDLAKTVLALNSTAKKKMPAKITGLRALERDVLEAQQAPNRESIDNIDPVNSAAASSSLAGDSGDVVLD